MTREKATNPANEFFIFICPGRRRPDTNCTQISRIESSLMMVKLSSNDQFCRWTGTDGTAERDPWFQIKSRTREKKTLRTDALRSFIGPVPALGQLNDDFRAEYSQKILDELVSQESHDIAATGGKRNNAVDDATTVGAIAATEFKKHARLFEQFVVIKSKLGITARTSAIGLVFTTAVCRYCNACSPACRIRRRPGFSCGN